MRVIEGRYGGENVINPFFAPPRVLGLIKGRTGGYWGFAVTEAVLQGFARLIAASFHRASLESVDNIGVLSRVASRGADCRDNGKAPMLQEPETAWS